MTSYFGTPKHYCAHCEYFLLLKGTKICNALAVPTNNIHEENECADWQAADYAGREERQQSLNERVRDGEPDLSNYSPSLAEWQQELASNLTSYMTYGEELSHASPAPRITFSRLREIMSALPDVEYALAAKQRRCNVRFFREPLLNEDISLDFYLVKVDGEYVWTYRGEVVMDEVPILDRQ